MKRSTNKASAKKSDSKVAKKSASSVSAGSARVGHFDIALVKQFTEFMRENDLVEIDLRQGDQEIRLRRGSALAQGQALYAAPSFAQASAQNNSVSAQPAAPAAEPARKHYVVTSPFVGTFYRSAGPNQDSFVEEGKTINVGDTLCIVEAMKLMNEIESEIKGRVVKILVSNSTPVEFGEPLFEIDPL